MDKNGYLPRYMKYLFRGTTRNLDFTLKDFADFNNDKTGTKRTKNLLRLIVTHMLYVEYKDHTLTSHFTGVSSARLSQWEHRYIKKTNDPLIPILERKIKTK